MNKEDRNIIFNEARRAVRIFSNNPLASANKAVEANKSFSPTVGKDALTSSGLIDWTISTINVAVDQYGLISVSCFGVNADGYTHAAIKHAQFKNVAGVITFDTIVTTLEQISATGSTLVFEPDGLVNRFYLNVFSNDVDMNWEVNYSVIIMDIPLSGGGA